MYTDSFPTVSQVHACVGGDCEGEELPLLVHQVVQHERARELNLIAYPEAQYFKISCFITLTLTHSSLFRRCQLVWEGIVKEKNFPDWSIKSFSTSQLAREYLRRHHVEQYWDLAMAEAIIEPDEDEVV